MGLTLSFISYGIAEVNYSYCHYYDIYYCTMIIEIIDFRMLVAYGQ